MRHLAIYYGKNSPEPQVFDEKLIPLPESTATLDGVSADDIKALIEKLASKNKESRDAEKQLLEQAKENEKLKKS